MATEYLRPSASVPYDDPLEDLFQAFLVGMTGTPGNLVRPRWQPDPPNQPQFDVNWIAFGVQAMDRQWDQYQYVNLDLAPDGSFVQEGREVLELSLSFYGPAHTAKRREFEDGLSIGDNLAHLRTLGISFQELRMPVVVPALMKRHWLTRSDVKAIFHRWVVRPYPIPSIDSASGTVSDGIVSAPISVTPSP